MNSNEIKNKAKQTIEKYNLLVKQELAIKSIIKKIKEEDKVLIREDITLLELAADNIASLADPYRIEANKLFKEAEKLARTESKLQSRFTL